MIESGRKAVYEAIVRRKSRAAIWRAIEISLAPGQPTGRNLGLPAGRIPKSRPTRGGNPFRIRNKSLMNQCIKNIPAGRISGTAVA
ncbi:hypothetical protein [Burkholderia ambifaria]|uniref:hypothetical protein n=1 Tax=Burkholderia ambifaria TaxID=152480 RepID=UPI003717514D